MSYIYEMDVTRLKLSYLLPTGIFVDNISTILTNHEPYDGTEISMSYELIIRSEYRKINGKLLFCAIFKHFSGCSYEDLIELVRRWVIEEKSDQHSDVNKFMESY
jgi:hypothetical protein